MAKKALIIKAAAKPKFKVRGYTRCSKCGRPRAVLRKFGRSLLAAPLVAGGDVGPHTAPHVAFCDHRADAAGAAGHQRDLAADVEQCVGHAFSFGSSYPVGARLLEQLAHGKQPVQTFRCAERISRGS